MNNSAFTQLGKINALRENGIIGSALLALLAFSLPLSTSASTMFALLIIPVALFQKDFTSKLKIALKNQAVIAILFFVALNAIGLLWTSDMTWGMEVIRKQWKFILLPIYITTVIPAHRQRYLYCFILALFISCLLSYLIWLEIINFRNINPSDPTPFLDHITFNCFLAFGLYILLHDILFRPLTKKHRTIITIMTVIMMPIIFITQGRTGQLTFFVLLTFLVFQYFDNKMIKATCAYLVIILILSAGTFLLNRNNPIFEERTLGVISRAFQHSTENENTSMGQRITFFSNSIFVFLSNPLTGVGTGNFPTEYQRINQIRSPNYPPADNPHNQYVLVACQFGILGLTALFAIFYQLGKQAIATKDEWRHIRIAFLAFYLIIMLSDTHLLGHGGSLLFSFGTATLFKNTGSVS